MARAVSVNEEEIKCCAVYIPAGSLSGSVKRHGRADIFEIDYEFVVARVDGTTVLIGRVHDNDAQCALAVVVNRLQRSLKAV